MFYDVFCNVHIVYMCCYIMFFWCSMMYLVMFYVVVSHVHLVYMWCSIVYFRIKKYACDILLNFSLLRVFFLMLCCRYHYFLFMLCIYFILFLCINYNTNFISLNWEHSFYKDETLFFKPKTSSLLSNRKCSIFVGQMFVKIFLSKNIHVGSYFEEFIAKNMMM